MIAKVKKNPTDPIAIIVGGVIEILAILGVPEQLGLDATQVAQLGGALIMVAGSIRFMLTKLDNETPAAQDSSPDEEPEAEKETPTPDASEETPEEPADSAGDDENTPVVGPPPSTS